MLVKYPYTNTNRVLPNETLKHSGMLPQISNIQAVADDVSKWTKQINMEMNLSKTKELMICFSKNPVFPPLITIDDDEIETHFTYTCILEHTYFKCTTTLACMLNGYQIWLNTTNYPSFFFLFVNKTKSSARLKIMVLNLHFGLFVGSWYLYCAMESFILYILVVPQGVTVLPY